ncbi:MAG: hypothetical protein HY801_08610 [Candidatus Lindowbacteria bacterium]|nr:hypothetical protein [Candidatus Lindowbacteria bacterium]
MARCHRIKDRPVLRVCPEYLQKKGSFHLTRGQTFRCSICGAELIVMRAGSGELQPICCNQPMVLLKRKTTMYRCPICGTEVAVLNSKMASMKLICCNVPMRVLATQTAANP